MSRTTDLRRIPLTVDPDARPPWRLNEAIEELELRSAAPESPRGDDHR